MLAEGTPTKAERDRAVGAEARALNEAATDRRGSEQMACVAWGRHEQAEKYRRERESASARRQVQGCLLRRRNLVAAVPANPALMSSVIAGSGAALGSAPMSLKSRRRSEMLGVHSVDAWAK